MYNIIISVRYWFYPLLLFIVMLEDSDQDQDILLLRLNITIITIIKDTIHTDTLPNTMILTTIQATTDHLDKEIFIGMMRNTFMYIKVDFSKYVNVNVLGNNFEFMYYLQNLRFYRPISKRCLALWSWFVER